MIDKNIFAIRFWIIVFIGMTHERYMELKLIFGSRVYENYIQIVKVLVKNGVSREEAHNYQRYDMKVKLFTSIFEGDNKYKDRAGYKEFTKTIGVEP